MPYTVWLLLLYFHYIANIKLILGHQIFTLLYKHIFKKIKINPVFQQGCQPTCGTLRIAGLLQKLRVPL